MKIKNGSGLLSSLSYFWRNADPVLKFGTLATAIIAASMLASTFLIPTADIVALGEIGLLMVVLVFCVVPYLEPHDWKAKHRADQEAPISEGSEMKIKNSDSRIARTIRAYMSASGPTRIGILVWLITFGLIVYGVITGNVALVCIALISLPFSGLTFFSFGHLLTEQRQREAAEVAQGSGVLYVVSPHDGEFEPITDPTEQRMVLEMIAQHRQAMEED